MPNGKRITRVVHVAAPTKGIEFRYRAPRRTASTARIAQGFPRSYPNATHLQYRVHVAPARVLVLHATDARVDPAEEFPHCDETKAQTSVVRFLLPLCNVTLAPFTFPRIYPECRYRVSRARPRRARRIDASDSVARAAHFKGHRVAQSRAAERSARTDFLINIPRTDDGIPRPTDTFVAPVSFVSLVRRPLSPAGSPP